MLGYVRKIVILYNIVRQYVVGAASHPLCVGWGEYPPLTPLCKFPPMFPSPLLSYMGGVAAHANSGQKFRLFQKGVGV